MIRILCTCIMGLAALWAAPAFAQQSIGCESTNGERQHCSVDTSGGVSLYRQDSRSGCYQNETWGTDRLGIWVSNGCRAQFRVGNPGNSRSNNGDKVAAVAAIALIGAAVIAANHDKHKDGDHYDDDGYDDDYDKGCRAARRDRDWDDWQSKAWKHGYRDCD